MKTRTKKFIQTAIKNGYRSDNTCAGRDWIKKNLKDLSFIFSTEEYKECNGMKNKCMPVLFALSKTSKNELSGLEKDLLETAWYYNNLARYKQKKELKIKKFNDKGFYLIKNNPKLDKRKIEFIIDNSNELFGTTEKYTGKLKWSKVDKRLIAMKSKAKRWGIWVDSCENKVYIKLI